MSQNTGGPVNSKPRPLEGAPVATLYRTLNDVHFALRMKYESVRNVK
jgi:hypothetical protein